MAVSAGGADNYAAHVSLNMVPEMLQVKEWYVTALERNTALSQRERDNYYGELEVILSFLASTASPV